MTDIARALYTNYQQVKEDFSDIPQAFQENGLSKAFISLDKALGPIPLVSAINDLAVLVIKFLVSNKLIFYSSSDFTAKVYFSKKSLSQSFQNIMTLGLLNAGKSLLGILPRILTTDKEIIDHFCQISRFQKALLFSEEAINRPLMKASLEKQKELLSKGTYQRLSSDFYTHFRRLAEEIDPIDRVNKLKEASKQDLLNLALEIHKKMGRGTASKTEIDFLENFSQEWFDLFENKGSTVLDKLQEETTVKPSINRFLDIYFRKTFELTELKGFLGISVEDTNKTPGVDKRTIQNGDRPTPHDFKLSCNLFFDFPLPKSIREEDPDNNFDSIIGEELIPFLRLAGLEIGQVFHMRAFLKEGNPTMRCFFHSFCYSTKETVKETGPYGEDTEKTKDIFKKTYFSNKNIALENWLPFPSTIHLNASNAIIAEEQYFISNMNLIRISYNEIFKNSSTGVISAEKPFKEFPKKPFFLKIENSNSSNHFRFCVERASRKDEVTINWCFSGICISLDMNPEQVGETVTLLYRAEKSLQKKKTSLLFQENMQISLSKDKLSAFDFLTTLSKTVHLLETLEKS